MRFSQPTQQRLISCSEEQRNPQDQCHSAPEEVSGHPDGRSRFDSGPAGRHGPTAAEHKLLLQLLQEQQEQMVTSRQYIQQMIRQQQRQIMQWQQQQQQQQQQQRLPWVLDNLKKLLPPQLFSWLVKTTTENIRRSIHGDSSSSSSSNGRRNCSSNSGNSNRITSSTADGGAHLAAALRQLLAAVLRDPSTLQFAAPAAAETATTAPAATAKPMASSPAATPVVAPAVAPAAAPAAAQAETTAPFRSLSNGRKKQLKQHEQQQSELHQTVQPRGRGRSRLAAASSHQQQQQHQGEGEGSDWLLRYEGRRLGISLRRESVEHSFDPRYTHNVKLSPDRNTATGGRNWGSSLSRCCCSWGSFYFEVKVGPLGPHSGSGPSGNIVYAADQVPNLPIKGWGPAKTTKQVAMEYEDEFVVGPHNALGPCLRIGVSSRLSPPLAPLGSNPFGYAIGSYCEIPQQRELESSLSEERCSCSCSTCGNICNNKPSPSDTPSLRDIKLVRGAPRRRGLFVVTRGRRKRLKRSDVFFPMQPPCDEPLGPQGSTEAVEAVEGGNAAQHLSPPTDEASDDLAAAALDAATSAAAANVYAGSRKGRLCRCGCTACGDPYGDASRASHMSAAAPALRDGDIVGCFVHLPGRPPATLEDPRGRPSLWRFLQQGLLCDVTHESTLPKGVIYPRSFISFSVNGCVYHRVLGPLLCCELHPAVSLFNGASATLNLGPNFAFLPRELRRYFRPAREMLTSVYPLKHDLVKFYLLAADSNSSGKNSREDEADANRSSKRLRTIAEVEGMKDEAPDGQQQQPLRFVPFDEATHLRKLKAAAPQFPSCSASMQHQQQRRLQRQQQQS
ncbi:hypothetical protein, conserved [Eimeria tenella]|uniref:SPRY domain-containing protein n=1 Tax=Eimeria tenella TaxID=5802 RepID=U6KPZ8_EIMTE|nr:hypothetical protein, conserved [Eimeria tenella]CDJ40041.1 hypothetical protein, conserved [Eimeria tenella]|eukprot:XP_013230794.1 hypothetical protein, conserved [Eimeria tenella]